MIVPAVGGFQQQLKRVWQVDEDAEYGIFNAYMHIARGFR